MRFFVILLFTILESQVSAAQKRPLDLAAIDTWPQIEDEKISNDGRFLVFNVTSNKDGTRMVIQSTTGSYNLEIKDATNADITEDSRHLIFKKNSDSIGIVELGKKDVRYLDRIISFKIPHAGDGEWLAYIQESQEKDLIILNLATGTKRTYTNIKHFNFSTNGNFLLIVQTVNYNSRQMDSVTCLEIKNGISHSVWCGSGAFNWAMDNNGAQIAFLRQRMMNDQKTNEVWYYKLGMDNASILVNDSTNGMKEMTVGKGALYFSADANNLFFYLRPLQKITLGEQPKNQSNPIIWKYSDQILNFHSGQFVRELEAVINLQFRKKVVRIETKEDDQSIARFKSSYCNNKTLVFSSLIGSPAEYKWRKSALPNMYIVSTTDGSRKLLKENCVLGPGWEFRFSPSGKFVIWYDLTKKHWFSYNLKTQHIKNITSKIPFPLCNNNDERPRFSFPEGIMGWMEKDTALLLYDNYDIWDVDPDAQRPPKNITFGFGRNHRTILRYLSINEDIPKVFNTRDTIHLYFFNPISKYNGFAEVELEKSNKLTILLDTPMRYYGVFSLGLSADPLNWFALKAKFAKAYVFKPTRDTVYPNLSFSSDLVHFHKLTYLQPHKKYNWYTNQLIHWTQPDGKKNEGILFKPEDFDPRKKYPLIVFIYEKFSDALNVFLKPALSRGDMEILWYVSHGYLILVPDIHYAIGRPGKSAYNSVISAINYLSMNPWLNSKRLGLQGHSFGGYETNYIVTRTNIFAAAASANGVSDVVSESGQLSNNSGNQAFFELGQGRMGATLWESPSLFIQESPVFKANKVTTPLLILHNPLDDAVGFSQAAEWFTALRRLGKKVWMLQYPNEGHNIEQQANKLDYSTRLNQFFDHFLKGAPVPQWMYEE